MGSCIENLQYHLVWSTKYRYRFLTVEMSEILKNYFLKKQEIWNYKIVSITIEPEHIHLLIQVKSSQVDLNKLIARLKGGSSFLLRKIFRYLLSYPSLWAPSHFVAPVGNISEKTIEEYLNKQGIEEKEIVIRTFKYKVFEPTKKKARLLRQYFKACLKNDKERVPSGILQDFKRVKRKENEFGLYLREQLLEIKKGNGQIKYWLRIPGSKYEKPFWLGLMGRDLPKDYELTDSTIREIKGVYYIYLPIRQERIIKKVDDKKVIAVDLGVNHPITSVMLIDNKVKDCHFYGKEMKNQMYRRNKRLAQLQSSEVENPKEKIQNYTNRIKELVHNYTNDIIKQARETESSIVVGNLRGIKDIWVKGKSNKITRSEANRIPYGRIMNQLWYKGTLNNIPVIFVNEEYTSQRCSRCGSVNPLNRTGERFECKSCKYQNQADMNGAINIGTIALANLLSQSHQALRQNNVNTSLCALAIGR